MTNILEVKVPIANLRREPQDYRGGPDRDLLQETQLLLGEKVELLEEKGDWLRVHAIEQPKCCEGVWMGYPGWIRSYEAAEAIPRLGRNVTVSIPNAILEEEKGLVRVSLGVRLPLAERHDEFCSVYLPEGKVGRLPLNAVILDGENLPPPHEVAEQLLKTPYFWGGRSSYQEGLATGVDCSGLVNLAYRATGLDIPRDAWDQFLACDAISRRELRVGDLIFQNDAKPSARVDHVMFYMGGEKILESRMDAGVVRFSTFKENFGYPLGELEWGSLARGVQVWFGRL